MDILPNEHPSEVDQLSQGPATRAISGFWRRVLAFTLDGIILGIVGFIIGIPFFDAFARLGGWGKLIGFFLALLYFGLLNSSVGNGQTIGKRLLKVEVVDKQGKYIAPGLSIFRYAILAVPFFLNGALIPPSLIASPLGYLLGLLVFGLGLAIIYLYVFNRRTRQSVHDLACGTFVVRTFPKGEVSIAPMWRPHLVIIGAWFAVVLVGLFVVQIIAQKGVFPGLRATQEAIVSSGKVHAATLSVGQTWNTSNAGRAKTTYLSSNAIWKERPTAVEPAAKDVAKIILEHYPDVMAKDTLVVTVTYGYDIGIASAWRNRTFRHSPVEWKTLIESSLSTNKL